MPERGDPAEYTSTPRRDQPAADPSAYRPQSPLDQFVATTLSEIQQEQGRLMERTSTIIRDVDGVSRKVDALKGAYTFIKGFAAAVFIVVPFAATLLWWSLSDRIEKLRVLLDGRPAQSQQIQPPRRP